MAVLAVAWSVFLRGVVGLPKFASILLAMLLGPATVFLGAFAFTRWLERRTGAGDVDNDESLDK